MFVGVGQVGWLLTLWTFLALHRLGVVLIESFQDPLGIILEFPGIDGFALLSWPLGLFEWGWLLLVIVLGLLHPAAAEHFEEEGSRDLVPREERFLEDGEPPGGQCATCRLLVEEHNGFIEEGLKALAVVALWETLKQVWCWFCRRNSSVAATQTFGLEYVPMPLMDGMPNRAGILYSLWRSGHSPSVEEYPPDVQEEYYGYVGAYLRRQADEEASSED